MDTIRFKPVTMLRITGILLVLLLGVFSLAQDIGLTGPSGLEVSVCGDGQFTITVTNGDTDISNLDIYAAVVTGGGSVIPTNDFTLVYESGTPNPAPNSYTITPATVTWSDRTLAADATWTGGLTVSPHCDAFSNRELVVMVSYDYYDGVDLVHVVETPVYSGPLQVLMPNLVVELDPEVLYGIAPGETASWPVYVSNTGDGILSDGTLTAVLAPGGGLDNLTFTPPSGSPAPLAAPIPMPDLTAGAPRTFLGTVSADLTVGTATSCKDIYVTFTGNFGCESLNCQPDVVVTGSVNLEYRTPNLTYSFSPDPISTIPYCGSTSVTVTVENPGATAGNIVGLQMTVDAFGMEYTITGDTSTEVDVLVDAGSNIFRFVDAANHSLPAVIGPDDEFDFTFDVSRDGCATLDCRSLIFIPQFYDDCGDVFEPPIQELQISAYPPATSDYDLTVTPDAGNPAIPDEGATLGYTITAVYNAQAGETDATADIVVTYPATFSIAAGTDTGYTDTGANEITWGNEAFGPTTWTVTKRLVLTAGYAGADCEDDFTLHFAVEPTSGMCEGDCPPEGATANLGLLSDTLLVVTKTAAGGGDGIIYVGEPLDFTVNVYYYGPRLLIGGSLVTPPAFVTDTLPAGFWLEESLPPDPPDPVVNPDPVDTTANPLTWCLDAGDLSQTGPVTFTYSLEPIPLGYPGYDLCLCGTTITNTARATLNTTGAAPCAVTDSSPFGCSDEAVLSFAYNCDYGTPATGFEVEKTAAPASAERCDYEDGITFTNTITFNQAYSSWNDITFTDNGNIIGMAFSEAIPLSGTANFSITAGPSAGENEDYLITLGNPVVLGSSGVGLTGGPQAGDELEITYTLYFSSAANTTGTTVVNWSDFTVSTVPTVCDDGTNEFHAGAWVTPINPSPTVTISDYCHYDDEGHCTFVVNRCDSSTFRLYLTSTRVERDVIVRIELLDNYTFDTGIPTSFININRPDGTPVGAFAPDTSTPGEVTWNLGDLGVMGSDSYLQFNLMTACSGGTETNATVESSGWCGDYDYSNSMSYRASRGERKGKLLLKKTPDVIYIKDRGANLPWTIYVTNPGSGPATNVVVTDTLGAGISYVDGSATLDGAPVTPVVVPSAYASGVETTVTFTIDELAPGTTATITLTGHVEDCENRTNRVRATWGCYDEVTGFDYCGEAMAGPVTVQDLGTRVIINRHQADDINTCGGTSFVTVVFKNIGKAYAYDMLLTETLPLGVEYDTAYPGGWTAVDAFGNNLAAYVAFVDGSNHTTGGGTLTWTFTNSMKPVDNSGEGDEFTIRFPVKIVGCDYASGASMMANLNYDTPCSTATSPAQDTVSTVSAPVLEVTKGPDITAGDPSDPIIWDIEISNPSIYTAMAVFLWDIPDPSGYFSSVTINGLSGSGTEIDPWDIGNIAPGDSMMFTARGILSDCYPTTTGSNTAWVEWCEDCKTSASSNISMINSTPHVTPGIDLDVDYCGGSVTITLVNTGSRAYDVVLTDVFPTGFEYTVGSAEITSSEGRTFSEANEEPHYDVPTRTLTWDSNAATAPVFMDTAGNRYIEKLETLTITLNLENEMEAGEQCTSTFGDTHTVSIHYEDACDDTYDETTTGTATIPAYPNLTVTKVLDPVYGVIGETDPALWHVTIANSGGPAYGTITIVDTFGSGWDMATVNAPDTVNGTGTRTIDTGARTVTWSGVSLDTGPSSETIDIWVQPLSTSPEADLSNSVLVTGACIGGCNYESAAATQNIVPGHSEIVKVYDMATATIGETVHVTITSSYFGAGTPYEDVLVVDTLPTGLTYAGNLTINGIPSSITPVGQTLTWDLGDFSGTQVYVIEFDTFVANTADTDNGDTLPNTATTTYLVGATSYTDSSTTTLTIVEALLTIDKTYAVVGGGPVEGSAVIEYTLTLRNTGTSTAFDIDIADTLGAGLINPVYQSGGDSHDFSGNPLLWHVNSLAVGASTTLVYRVAVEDSVTPCSMLNNEAVVTWTSINGTPALPADERTGSGSPAWNDYRTSDTLQVPVDTVASITKSLVPPTDGYWTIGSEVNYLIRVMLPRTTISDLTVTDVIGTAGNANNGLRYVSATFVAPGGGALPSAPGESVSSPNDGTVPVTVTWTFSNIPGYDADTSGSGRYLWIAVTAVVTNVAQNNNGDSIPNRVTATDSGSCLTWPSGNSASSTNVLVREANLTIDKTYAVIGATPVEAGAVIEYTLTLANNGTCTAFDIDVEDTLGAGLTSPSWVSGGNSHDFTTSYPTLLWHVNSLAVGASTTLVYRVTVEDSVTPCSMLNNEAVVTWTSLNGSVAEERTGSGSPAWNDYRTSDTLDVPVDTVASITKDLQPPADGYWTIGSDVYYQIRVMLPRTTISDLTVTDVFGTAGNANNGLRYEGATFIAPGGGSISPTSTTISSPNDGTVPVTVTWEFANIPGYDADASGTGRYLWIIVHAVVTNVDQNNDGDSIPNRVTATDSGSCLTWPGGNSASSANVLVREANLTIDKTYAVISASGLVEAGAVIRYTLTLENESTVCTAYDIEVEDTLGPGLTGPSWVSGGNSHDFSGNPLLWYVDSLAPGASTTLVYDVTVAGTGDVVACSTLDNEAMVTWTSLNGSPAEERTGSGTPTWNDYRTSDTLQIPVNTAAAITKTLTSDTTVTIGSTATYDINITLPQARITDLTVTETIGGAGIASNGLRFVNATFTAPGGGSIAPTSTTVSTPNDGTGPVTVTWVFANIPGYLATPANRDLVIHVTTDVPDVTENKDGDVIPNSVTATDTASCLTWPGGNSASSADVTVRVPALTIVKSVSSIVGADGVARPTVEPGGVVTYSVTINNVGSGEASDITISDTMLPQFDNPVHLSGADSHDFSGSPLLTWHINTIAGYGSVTVTYSVTATSAIVEGSVYENCASVVGHDILGNEIPADNTAHVSADTYDTATGTDRSCAQVTGAVPTLALDKEILSVNGVAYTSDMTVQPGDYLIYRVIVTNTGTGTAYDLDITDTLSEGLGYGDYLAPAGDIPPTLPATGTYTSAAWSDYYDAGGAPAGSLTAHTHGNAPEDLVGTVPATIGTLTWDGSDIRPLSLPASSPNASVTGIVLPGGQTYTIEYLAYVNGAIIQHSVAENLADAEAKDGRGTTVPCNEDRTSINTREPFFVTEKTITQIDGDPANTLVAVVDSIIDYSFTITNVGEGDAHNVNIFDTLPIGFVYVPGSANIGEPTISLDGRDLTWLVNADIASGGIYTVTFQAEVTDGTSGGTMYNVMWVEGLDLSDQPVTKDGSAITPLDTDADDLDDVPVEVDIPNVPLILVKDVTPRSVSAGAVVHYTVTFTNNRKISFYDATITDTMPHGFTYKPGTALLDGVLIADPTGNNPYVFSIGTVGPESSVRLDYYVLVSQSARHGANVNWAVLNAHDGAGKPISLKDRATVTVTDDSFFDFEKFPFLPRFSRPTAAPEVPRVPEKERPRPECCLVVTAIPVRSQDFGDTVPGRPEIYYQTDIAMYAATELLVTEKRMTPWLEVQGFDPERTYLMTGLYNRMITKLGEYAQYNLGNVVMESLLGIPLEYAPGVLEKARREGTTPERAGTELTRDLAERAGLSAVPEIQPIFLEYFGSYPYLHERIAEDKLAWEEGLMDKNIMPAALGFTLLREAGQIEMFLVSTDPTERFFGLLLLTQAIEKTRSISTDLAKTAEFSPPVKYLPHFSRIEVEKGRGLTWRTTDETSTLYDHASVLWGLSKLRSVALHSADPDVRALVPQITERMNEIYRAIEAIHYDEQSKGFVSVHAPGKGDDEKSVAAKDLAFTILAMRSVLFDNRDLSINTVDPKRKIVEIADFMIEELMSDDGGVYTAYNYADGTPVVGVKRTLVDNALAVRALLSAYVVTEDRKYRNAALKVYAFMVKELWYEDLMIFIDEEDPDYEVVLTPQSIGALIGALRDLVLYGDPTMRYDYLDRMSYTTDRVLDQSQLQLYENRFFPWHAPITIVPKDPNGRSYIKPIVTTIRDKGISHDLAPILVRKMVLNITPSGAIASGNEDSVSDWNKWKADLRYEVPDVIASAVIDDTFVTDEGMYFTTLTRDYQQNLNANLPAFNPYHTDPGIQVYGAFVGGEVSSYNVKNLTLNSRMGIGLSESELVRRLAKKTMKNPEKYLTDYVKARAPKDAAGDDIVSRFIDRVKGAVGLSGDGRFTDIIYLEYTSSKPFYTEGISDGWDEKTFDEKLTVSSMSSTMVRQLMFILDNSGRTDLSASDRFVNDVITMSVAAKRVALGEIIRTAKKDGIAGVPHSFAMVPDKKEKRSVVEITEKKSTLFDDTFAIWAMALYIDARQKGLFNAYRAVMTDVTDDEAVLAELIDTLIEHHYNAEYGTLVTGSVNTVEVSKALDMLTRAAEVMDDGPAREKLTGLIRKQADFIMTRLATDTGFEPMIGLGGETIPSDLCEFETLGTNVFPILALVRTWEVTGDEKYLNRALVYFDRFDESKWDQEIGLYLSSGTIYKATDVSKLELNYNNQELIAAVLLISKLQPHLSGERKILSAYHMTTFMNRIMEIASVERYPGNEDSDNTIFSPEIIRSVKIILSESRGVGKPGDVFTNRIVIDNDCYDGIARPLTRIRIEQTLPDGFHYVPGSTRFNGAAGPDPIGRKTLNWYYPALNGRNRLVIDYQVVADPKIAEGSYTATLDVMAFSGYGGDYVLCEDRDIAATTLIVADPFAEVVEKSCVPCDVGRRALSR